jgi:hypothetical protein
MSVFSFQQVVSTTAVQIPTFNITNGFTLTAPLSNAAAVYIGGPGISTVSGYPLSPGNSLNFDNLKTTTGMFVVGANNTDQLNGIGY